MRRRTPFTPILLVLTLVFLVGMPAGAWAGQTQGSRAMESLKQEVRHELVTLPYYSVFDWLQADIKPDGTVVLEGQVTRPTLKSDAEARIEKVEGANRVVNNIEVLPLSNFDDELRMNVFRAIYSYSSPLFTKYGLHAVGPIHVILKNGHITLKGVVDSEADSQLAYIKAREVPGAFSVKNELQVLKDMKPIS